MIPFPFNENSFLFFFFADHLLVGQLGTNPKNDRSDLKVSESDIMFNERDRRRAAVQHMLSTNPSYDNRTIASTLKMQIQTVQRAQGDENKVRATSCHLTSSKSAWKSKECYDFVPFSLWPLFPRPEPAGLLRLVIRREHYQHDLPQHQSQPDRRHPPSIRRAPAGAGGKGIDPYRGGAWGWRRLHWIDVSSTT